MLSIGTGRVIKKLTTFESEGAYREYLLQVFALIVLGALTISFLINSFITLVLEPRPIDMLTGTPPLILAVILFNFWVYRLALQKRYKLASRLLTGSLTILVMVVYFRFGTSVPLFITFFIPLGVAINLLRVREALGVAAICGTTTVLLYLLQNFAKVYSPPVSFTEDILAITSFTLIVIFFPVTVALWLLPARGVAHFLQERNYKLEEALEEITRQQHAGREVGQKVIELASNLKVSATQQNQTSRQQVNAVAMVNTAVSELSSASVQIAQLADKVNSSVQEMEHNSQQIEETTSTSVQHSEKGQTAINNTKVAGEKIGTLYQQLMDTLLDLNSKTSNMRRILELLSNISSETHLLSLNAAIEAAGAGEYGERFGVVAHEVKILAQRSNDAGKEVVEIVRQIEEATRQAVISAQSGSQLAHELNIVTEQTSNVIEGLRLISEKSFEQAEAISHTTEGVLSLTSMIKASTQQQRSASQRVLQSLSNLTELARQNVEGSGSVSGAAFELENTSTRLKVN